MWMGKGMNALRHLYGKVMSIQDLVDVSSDCRILRIVFSSAEQVRSRRVVTRSRFRPTGKYPSWKMERMLQWESMNELNAFRLLDCDPRVAVFTEQPARSFISTGPRPGTTIQTFTSKSTVTRNFGR